MKHAALAALASTAVLAVTGCDAEEVAEDQNLPVPQDTREVRSEETVNRFFGAIDDRDWDRACEQLAPRGVRQLGRAAGAPASVPCPELLSATLSESGDLGRVEVTEATPSSGRGITVKTEGGDEFVLDGEYRIAEFTLPE